VYVLTNTHAPPAKIKFRDESRDPVKPLVTEDYDTCMDYVDSRDKMATNYSICTSQIWSLPVL
jgi:hypothetical protein